MLEMIRPDEPVMLVIILCSVVALAFIIERFLAFQQAKTNMEVFFPQIEKAIKVGKFEEGMKLCQASQGIIPKVIFVGLRYKDENIEDLRKLLIDEIQIRALPTLNKYLSVLSTIAKSAPMLGLLGTVLGMIRLFRVIGEEGLGDPQKMADGIGLAMVTTAGGLIVAIPIIFAYSYFKSQIRNFELDLYHYLTRFLRLIRKYQEVSKTNG